jgi:hypothetical protein
MAVNVAVKEKSWWLWKVPKWPWFLLGVAAKACRDLATCNYRNDHKPD